MNTLVLVEHDNTSVNDATLAVVTAAGKMGDVTALVAGHDCGSVAEAAAKIAGVSKVLKADDAAYAASLAENVAPLVAGIMADYDAFLVPATTSGKNIAPRVAAHLDVMQISDILSVDGDKTFTRPIYAGNAIATVQSSDAKLVITVRGTAFEKAATEGGSASVEDASGPGDAGISSFVSREVAKSERPELTSAKSSYQADARLKTARLSSKSSTRLPINSAPQSAHRALRLMRAMSRTIIRSARRVRSSHPKCTSPSASPARSNTLPA